MVLRLGSILGDAGKYNEVIFCGESSETSTPSSNVVFFGGDLQNYKENMRDDQYSKWNLESTASLLHARFPQSLVWVVKPSVMEENTYSVYKNFVSSGTYGIPWHKSDQRSWFHLYWLLKNSIAQLQTSETFCRKNDIFNLPLKIVGFSKGCVVLNQLLYDIRCENEDVQSFIKRVDTFYWLDGGHNGRSNTWVTDPDVLSALVDLKVKVEAHVSPYQIEDKARCWIGKEYRLFIKTLEQMGISLISKIHGQGTARSLNIHFSILTHF